MMYGVWSVPGPSRLWGTVWRMLLAHRQSRAMQSVGRIVTLEFDGWKVCYDLSNTGDYGQYWRVVKDGGYEPATTALLKEVLVPGSVFVDLGANIGYYTAEAIGLVGPKGRIWSFEPNPTVFARLRMNIQLNHGDTQVRAFMVAVSDLPGRKPLYLFGLFGDEDTGASLVAHSQRSVDVELAPADSFLANESVDLVKMDIEGAELSALRGMTETFRRNPNLSLIIEWNRGYQTRELWDFLDGKFTIHRIRNHPRGCELARIRTYDDAKRLPRVNLWCSPP